MKNNPILDDSFYKDELHKNSKEFQIYHEEYLAAVAKTTLWRWLALFGLGIIITQALFFVHSDLRWLGEMLSYSFFAVLLLALIAYFQHLFALQLGAKMAYLFPTAEQNFNPNKLYNPWLLLVLSLGLVMVSDFISISIGDVLLHTFKLLIYALGLHACFFGVQRLLLRKYIAYLPAIFNKTPFPSLGFAPFLSWVVSFLTLLMLLFTPFSPDVDFFIYSALLSLIFLVLYVSFALGFLYIGLHLQAYRHSISVKERNN